jgi:hypothetical protein
MNAIISIFGMLLSAVGIGTSTVSQVQTFRNQAPPQAQVQTYQQCPSGYGQVRQAPDGHYYIECLEVRQ